MPRRPTTNAGKLVAHCLHSEAWPDCMYTGVASQSSLAQRGMAQSLPSEAWPDYVYRCWPSPITCLKKILASHPKCLNKTLALHPKCLNKCLPSHPKCLNKSLGSMQRFEHKSFFALKMLLHTQNVCPSHFQNF